LVFPTIVVTFSKHYAAMRAQQAPGVLLSDLEVYLGSTDILSTLNTLFFVRSSTRSLGEGVGLLAYWGVGILSDQAILRALSVQSGYKNTNASLYYFDTSVDYAPSIFSPPDQVGTSGRSVDIVFQSGILSAPTTLNNPSDVWGNVKIPMLQDLNASTSEDLSPYMYTNLNSLNSGYVDDNYTWIPVPTSNVSYTSLIGNPIHGLSPESNSSFTITTSYFYATCEDPVLYADETAEFTWPVQDSSTCGKNSAPTLLGGNRKSNGTILGTCSVGSLSPNEWNGSATSASQLRPILFQSQSSQGISAFNCSIEYVTVEAIVDCVGSNCAVAYIQAANSSTASWISPLDNCTTAQNFYNQFAVACQSGQRTASNVPVSSILEVYLMSGSYEVAKTQPAVDLSQLSGADLSDRFTRVLNSFWTASIQPEFVPGTISAFDNATQNGPGVIQVDTAFSEPAPCFVGSFGWVTVLGFSCGVLILQGLLVLYWESVLREPSMFANTTSFMRVPLLEYDGGRIPGTAEKNSFVKYKDAELGEKNGRLVLVDRMKEETDSLGRLPLVEMRQATERMA
jgi:hypothetical protein